SCQANHPSCHRPVRPVNPPFPIRLLALESRWFAAPSCEGVPMRKLTLAWMAVLSLTSALHAQQPAWADKLFGSETVHDFGTVGRGAQLRYTFKMTNIYKVPLEITDVRVQCGCVKAEPAV